jgi:Kef-type K+ transport system membrane component KefB
MEPFTFTAATASTAATGAESATHDPHAARLALLLALFVMFASAKIFSEIFERLRQPAVVGEILAGVLIGPAMLGWVSMTPSIETLAEIGVILLMFSVGLETEPRAIFSVGKTATAVAILGVIFPFILGTAAVLLLASTIGLNAPLMPAIFVGVAMVATSVGITARVLADMNLLSHQSARVILAAAVIDDVLALLTLSTVAGLATGGSVDWIKIGSTALLAVGFVAVIALAGTRAMRVAAPKIDMLRLRDPLFVVAITLCLGLALLAEYIGIAAIIGAFLAGMVLADRSDQEHLLHKAESLVHMFLPFFLVSIGMQLKLDVFRNGWVIVLAVVLTILAVLGKYWGGLLAARGLGERTASQIGMGMVPRGEVGIVVAQIGFSLRVLDESLFGAVLFMAIATTLIAPPFLRSLFAGETGDSREANVSDQACVEEDPIAIH